VRDLVFALAVQVANAGSIGEKNRQFAGCGGCTQDNSGLVLGVLLAFSAAMVIVGSYMAWITRHYPDRWGQGRECRLLVYWAAGALVSFIIEVFTNIENLVFDWGYFVIFFFAGMLGVSTLLQVYIAVRKERALKDRRGSRIVSKALSTEQDSGLEALLNDKELLQAFEQHLVAELAIESLLFIKDAQAWKANYFDSGPQSRTSRARKIVANYIQTSGSMAVNISSDMHDDIIKLALSSDIPLTIFDGALSELKKLLNRGAYQRFIAKKQVAAIV